MKLKHLESAIQSICPITDFLGRPQISLEQYSTPCRLAAMILLEIQDMIENKVVMDLGCGCGVFSAGIGVLEASQIYCFDIDPNCLNITQQNLGNNLIRADYVQSNVKTMPVKDWADVVVTNPPFGTRNSGIDWVFVSKAVVLAPDVYSIHKTSTRKFFQKKCDEVNIQGEVLMSVPFSLPKLYKNHTRKSVDIDVDVWHFSRPAL
jgi:rRNA N6-adenosine-methyltransferase METTL5